MLSFALYRRPYADECTLLTGNALPLDSCRELSGRQGFVVAPFAATAQHPILVISPAAKARCHATSLEQLRQLPWPPTLAPVLAACQPAGDDSREASGAQPPAAADCRLDYHIDFMNFHAQIADGAFLKLVLSRDVLLPRGQESPLDLFCRACQRYPRVFIALVYTPLSGLWLTATPETLLANRQDEWLTMALAGTMPYSDDVRWTDKNIQEQRYVATYIIEQLEQFTTDFTEDGPHTTRAGHLAHLRSDFRFRLADASRVGDLLQALHPTPAVCGLPKQTAFRFIQANEHHDRSYYSGFVGPLFVDGLTDLYVTLRCMQILPAHYRLYAGGGLLRDSTEEAEWAETEVKLDTMRRVVGGEQAEASCDKEK